MNVTEIRPDKVSLARRRRLLGRSVRNALECHGDDFAGYALVTWDMRGRAHSAYLADVGMVGESLMPAFVHDAVNRHLAVALAQTVDAKPINGDA